MSKRLDRHVPARGLLGRKPKLTSPIPGKPDKLCQWPGTILPVTRQVIVKICCFKVKTTYYYFKHKGGMTLKTKTKPTATHYNHNAKTRLKHIIFRKVYKISTLPISQQCSIFAEISWHLAFMLMPLDISGQTPLLIKCNPNGSGTP